MESRNPAFRDLGQRGRSYGTAPSPSSQGLQDPYGAPPSYAPPAVEDGMTLDDVVVRGFLSLGVLVVTGGLAWAADVGFGVAIVAMLIGFGISLYMSFKGKANAPLVLGYAAAYGVAVGVISHVYNDAYNGIVVQAVIGTVLAFAAMLTVYSLRIIRVTPKLTKFVIGAGLALLGLMVLNLVVGIFNDGGIGIRTDSPIGWLFSIVAILAGCFFLLLDFDMVEQGVNQRLPRSFSWYCAFALTSSLVWIYLEILRLLSYFSGRD
ncbi:MAG: Bax inhibitor-1/YccA family protein [Streptosporangiaceae bacterium]